MKPGWNRAKGRRLRDDESGVAAIEFAMLGLPFFVTIFALVEIGIVFAGELVLDNAVDRIGRELRTGQIQTQSPTREEFAELVCDRVSFLFDCDELVIDLAVVDQYSQAGSRTSTDPRFQLGSGGQIVSLRVDYDWPIVTHVLRAAVGNDGKHLMSGMAAFQAERF